VSYKPPRKLRVIVLVERRLLPPRSLEGVEDKTREAWRTEYDVVSTLGQMGHQVWTVGIESELGPVREAIDERKPHVAFNLIEQFDGYPLFDQHVVSYLELTKQKYTGCNPRGLTITRDKALTSKILAYHRIHVPHFAVVPIGRSVRVTKRLRFPLFVKSVSDEGSEGIARASLVRDEEALRKRVEFIHEQNRTPALVEEYIEGREIYVGVIGNQRLQAFTPWELIMTNLAEGAPNIATGKLKWDIAYQKKLGVVTRAAKLAPNVKQELERLAKRIYRILGMSGYARVDCRLTEDGHVYVLEVNPNPQIAHQEDFADSAEHCGVKYEALLQRILRLGMCYDPTG
jgi:D-alanine-D-alanine ligase